MQDIHFKVAGGARLEYYPERTIPFAGSRFRQTIHAELEEGAEFGCTETFSTGRVQSGERLAFALYESRVEVRQAGRRVYLDRQRVVPDEHLRAPWLLGAADYVASGVWIGGGEVSEWPALPGELSTGRTAGGAVWRRGVAGRGPVLDARLNAAREQLRRQLFGAVPLTVRR